MSPSEPWTVGRLLAWTTEYLASHGSESPRLDAEVLLAEALRCRRIELYTAFDSVPEDRPRTAFRELVSRRAQGTPVAYLVRRREFYSLQFRVTPDVLIPRPETEFLVVTLLDLAKKRPATPSISICDVGTGSGILAVCAAKHLADATVVALDASPAALDVARGNARKHEVADRIELVQSDLFDALPPDRTFDFVLSNPPYVSTAEMDSLPPEIKNHEPHEALLAGPHGTEVIKRLIPQAAGHLRPGGHLLLEVSPMVYDAVCRLLEDDEQLQLEATIKDLARLPRVVQAVRK